MFFVIFDYFYLKQIAKNYRQDIVKKPKMIYNINKKGEDSMNNEDGLSEFMKFAYKCNKVRDITEAFEEYPAQEEWHKGKIENIIKEETVEYTIYEIGDIVFVRNYTYQDGRKGENHLFVIIDQNNIAVPIENFGMLISSKIDKIKYKGNLLLEKSKENGLNMDSIVKTDIVYKILNDQIMFKIGSVDKDKVEEYKASFYEINK